MDTMEVLVARGRSVMHDGATHGPGAVLHLAPEEAMHLLGTGFVRHPDAAESLPLPAVRLSEGSPDGTGRLFQSPSWEAQRQAAEAEKVAGS